MQIIVLTLLKARHKYFSSVIPIISVQMFDLKDFLMLRILSYLQLFFSFFFPPPTRQTTLTDISSVAESINQSFGHLYNISVLSSSVMLLEDLNCSQHWHGELRAYRIKPGSLPGGLLGSRLQPHSSEVGVQCFHPDPTSLCYSSQSEGSLLTVVPARW